MDIPVLSEVLTALAQGAGGEAGRRTWAALAGLTARICGHGSAEAQAAEAGIVIAAAGKGQRCTMAAISGAGGMGKTALAIRVLDQLADRFPGGLFHAALAAFGPAGPADPAMVLAGWLRAAGVAAQVAPASVEEAAALWRSVTADRPAGVLTDDAASAGQVRPLVPAAGLIVVKSRHRLPPPSPPIAKIGNC